MTESITQEQQEALQRFSDQHGRHWKSQLVALWAKGKDDSHQDGALLRQLRNTLGPTGLHRLRLPK